MGFLYPKLKTATIDKAMSAVVLAQYIKMYRLRTGLSQDEVAFLLGGAPTGGSRISRFELERRQPTLDVALGLEAILGAPLKDIFRGEYLEMEELARKRAGLIRLAVLREKDGPQKLRRLATLQRIIGDPADYEETSDPEA